MSGTKSSTRKLQDVGRLEGANPSLLRRDGRLATLPDADLERVARGSECQLIPAGNIVFTQDDGADAIYLLLDGAVRLERRAANGEMAGHRIVGPNASFGDDALLGAPGRYFSASTEAVSVVIRTPMSLIREVLAANPEIAQAWIHAVSSDLERRGHRMTRPLLDITNPAFPDAA